MWRVNLEDILMLVLYSGPLIPMTLVVLVSAVRRFRFWRNLAIMVTVCLVQATTFIPLVFFDADLHALLLSMAVGLPLLLAGFVYLILELGHRRPPSVGGRIPSDPPSAGGL